MRSRVAAATAASAVLGAYWLPAVAALVPGFARPVGIDTRVRSERGVLLTFDDGPHPQGTPSVLARLEAADTKAVFFVSGEQAERRPALLLEIADAGHEIGLHGYRHQSRRQWSARLVREDTRRALDVIATSVGEVPRLYRPPHGVFSVAGLATVKEAKLRALLWTRWGRDWERRATPDSITRRLTRGVSAGDVLLLHDADFYGSPGCWRNTVAALPAVFEALDRAGLKPAPLDTATSRTSAMSLSI